MKLIGAHVSVDGGVDKAPLNASLIGARAFALFTRNPSRWKSKPLSADTIAAFRDNCAQLGYTPDRILPHDSYLINLGSPDEGKLQQSREAFLDELARCRQLGLTMLNFHPGSHLNQMEPDACLDLIAESINLVLARSEGVKAVIENTAGQGSNLGFRFEHLRHIIDRIDDKSRIGVCVDTCHAFAAGYDFATDEGYTHAWDDFNRIVGFEYLCGMHLNDSKKGLGSKVDRHAPIGEGMLGRRFFEMLMADSRFEGIPMILETPDAGRWAEELKMLESFEK